MDVKIRILRISILLNLKAWVQTSLAGKLVPPDMSATSKSLSPKEFVVKEQEESRMCLGSRFMSTKKT